MNLNFIITILLVSLASILGLIIAIPLKYKIKKHKKYIILTELFLIILTIGELVKEGFAVTGWVIISILCGMLFLYTLDKLTRIRKINITLERKLLREIPKAIALGSAFAIDISLGLAIGILLAIYKIPKGALISLDNLIKKQIKKAFKELGTIQFAFITSGIVTFIILTEVNIFIKAIIMTFAAGMMILNVLEQGILFKD